MDLLFEYADFNEAAVQMTAAVLVLFIGLDGPLDDRGTGALVLRRAGHGHAGHRAIAAVVVNVTVAYLHCRAVRLDGPGVRDRGRGVARGVDPAGGILWRRHNDVDVAGSRATFGARCRRRSWPAALALGMLALDGHSPSDAGKLAVLGRAVIAGGIGALGYLAMSLVLRAPRSCPRSSASQPISCGARTPA